MAERTTITAKGYTPTVAEQIETHRDTALSMLAFVTEMLKGEAEEITLSGAPMEGLFHILDTIETHLCEANLLEAGK